MIETSKLYNFLDETHHFIIRFLDGQKIIHDLAMLSRLPENLSPSEKNSFEISRELVLNTIHMMSYLKHGESLGLFIDTKSPGFRFKIELHEIGAFRSLLLPKTYTQNKESEIGELQLSGLIRLVKFLPHQSRPYSSHLEFKNMPAKEIINHILDVSYQVQAKVIVSEKTDQSLLVMKLPSPQQKEVSDISMQEYMIKNKKHFFQLLDSDLNKKENRDQFVLDHFRELQYLHGKELKFQCSCSQEQMISGVAALALSEKVDDIFDGKTSIETNCDYCGSHYQVDKKDVLAQLKKH